MGERTKYVPGTFCWTDLTTTDQPAAKRFYTELFGWTVQDNPVGDGIVYSMMLVDGKPVAAISPQPQQQRDAGAPPVWNSYVSVDSADEALAKAKELGATVHAPAFDVLDVGRMGVLQDPQGAFVLIWQPKAHIGAGLVNGLGMLSWNELASPDVDGSTSFYSKLFGWSVAPFEGVEPPYFVIRNKDKSNGGMRQLMPAEPQPYWLVYFGVDDIDASRAKVSELGGTNIAEVVSIGPGQVSFVQDPQGAVFAFYAGQFEQ